MSSVAAVDNQRQSSPQFRLRSLDVFRGLTIAGMLLVNNPGSWSHIYAPLRHAAWHGWTPTDLIFPFFLFIVGVSMTFSFGKLRENGVSNRALFVKGMRRALILFGLGLLASGFPAFDLSTIRIPGVLQRIAVAYAVALPLVLFLRARARAGVVALLLLGYWALLTLVPLPDGNPPSLEQGRDLGAWIDRALFGESHLWAQSRTWDPEGLLSTLPAIATVLTGNFAGHWLRLGRASRDTIAGLLVAGAIGLGAGLLWNLSFPINKNLWTSSYVLFTSGFACVLLAGCYWLIDVRGVRRGTVPFVIFGTNAIAAFLLSSLLARVLNLVQVAGADGATSLKGWLWTVVFAPLAPPKTASLLFAVCYVLFWLGLMAVLYRRKIFIRI
jgi:predicted acyltransferase